MAKTKVTFKQKLADFKALSPEEKRAHLLRRLPVWILKIFLIYVGVVLLMLVGAGLLSAATGQWDTFWDMMMSV